MNKIQEEVMYFNRKAVEKELDLAAEELDSFGYKDLADKVDYYNERLMEVKSSKALPIIRRSLQRIEREATRRRGRKKESKTIDKRKLVELKKNARERKLAKAIKDRKTAKPNARITRLEALLKQRDKKIAGEEKVANLKHKVKARRLARLKAALKNKK